MDTGMRLKYHRVKKRMSVEELASGILSPKELKKIESGLKEPELKDLEALCKRLEIPLAPKDNPVGKVLVKNFKSLLLHPQSKAKVIEHYADIQDHPLVLNDETVELEYNIQQIRFYIVTGDLDNAEEKLKDVERLKDFMNQEQYYLYHKYVGNYHYILNEYNLALKTYLFADKISPSTLSPSERADLYYSVGISAAQCWETSLANKYSDLALRIYQQEFVPKRIVECHLTLAINERRSGNFKKSKEHFKHALTISNKLDYEPLKFDTEYNYGNFYFQFQNFELALEHLQKAMQYKPYEYTYDILLGYCLMIKCYIELNRLDNAKELIEKGYSMIKEKNLSLASPSNDSFKEVYIEFMCLYYYMNNEIEKFEEYLLENLIPILELHNKFFEVGFYLSLLGNTFTRQNQFFKAATAFKKSNQALKSLLTINEEWEE